MQDILVWILAYTMSENLAQIRATIAEIHIFWGIVFIGICTLYIVILWH